MDIRVRYPPSPTGLQHIGGVRTALFNYFFSRSQGGVFILRIEDTDQHRYDADSVADLYDTLEWLGIDWDEGPERGGDVGPYIQSERRDLYLKYADTLLESGHLYRCFCSAERLEKLRSSQGKSTGYDRLCRNLGADEVDHRVSQGEPSVLRLKIPLEGVTQFDDLLIGTVKRKNKDINPDPVLLKSDGLPTYHLANVVDDHLMGITHIMRGSEWMPSVPIHVVLYDALGWEPPVYCHLPLVHGKDGQKLGKRHGATSIRDFRDAGYLPEAILNYISLLGWSFDDQREFFTREELSRLFTLEKLNKAPAVFDYKKLDWFNGHYIRECDDERLESLVFPFLLRDEIIHDPMLDRERGIVKGMLPLIRERLRRLDEVGDAVRFLFADEIVYEVEALIPKKSDAGTTIKLLDAGESILRGSEELSDEDIEEQFRGKAEAMGVKLGALLMPIRVAVTGTTASPPLFGSIRLLGLEKSLARIELAIEKLKEHVDG